MMVHIHNNGLLASNMYHKFRWTCYSHFQSKK